MLLTTNQLRAQVEAFAQGELGLPALRDWFKPYLIENELDVPDGNESLVYQVMFAFEDDSIPETKHRLNAQRLIRAMTQVAKPSELVRAFLLLRHQDRLGDILDKHFAGIITRVGLLNAISNSDQLPELKRWLSAASDEQLRSLRAALSNENYRDALTLTLA